MNINKQHIKKRIVYFVCSVLALVTLIYCSFYTPDLDGKVFFSVDGEVVDENYFFPLDSLANLNHDVFQSINKTKSDTFALIWFDAYCSACVSIFLQYLANNEINDSYTYIYVGATDFDLLLIEYYMEKHARELFLNEYLLSDVGYMFQFYYPNINTDKIPIILFRKEDGQIFHAQSIYNSVVL